MNMSIIVSTVCLCVDFKVTASFRINKAIFLFCQWEPLEINSLSNNFHSFPVKSWYKACWYKCLYSSYNALYSHTNACISLIQRFVCTIACTSVCTSCTNVCMGFFLACFFAHTNDCTYKALYKVKSLLLVVHTIVCMGKIHTFFCFPYKLLYKNERFSCFWLYENGLFFNWAARVYDSFLWYALKLTVDFKLTNTRSIQKHLSISIMSQNFLFISIFRISTLNS
jgi:hypothetical protein